MVSTNANAVTGPTPTCRIKQTAGGRLSAAWITASSNSPNESRESLSQSIEKYRTSGNLSEAARSLRLAINLDEKAYGPRSREVAEDFDKLSDVFREDTKYAEAESALKAALAIYVIVEGPERTTNARFRFRRYQMG
jgi:hypothetical protein